MEKIFFLMLPTIYKIIHSSVTVGVFLSCILDFNCLLIQAIILNTFRIPALKMLLNVIY